MVGGMAFAVSALVKITQVPTRIGTIVSMTSEGIPLVLFDEATAPVKGRIAFPVSREQLERAIVEQQAVIGCFAEGDTTPTILMSRNQPPPLHCPDDESVDLDTLLAMIQIMRGNRQAPSTVGGAVRMRLRELQAPVRLARHNDARFCIEALARLPDVTHDLSPDQLDDLFALVSELHARGTAASKSEEKEASRWRREAGPRISRLQRKLDASRNAEADLRKQLTRIDIDASALQSAVHSSLSDDLPSLREVVGMTQPLRWRPDAKVALFDFFVGQCGVGKDDAEVRVGKIVNLVFDSNISVIEQPTSRSDERRGSEAVRKAVERKRASERKMRVGQVTQNPPQS
jgi:hypothetical protein